MVKLHLGCGHEYWKDYVNCDIDNRLKADKYFDLNMTPYPFKDNSIDEIQLHHVLEHLDNPITVLEELWRISKDKTKIVIAVPHFSHFTAHGDLTHKRTYSSASMLYFEIGEGKYYSNIADFKVLSKKFTLTRTNFRFMNVFSPILNISPTFTDLVLCKVIPVCQIIFTLEVRK